jgi:small subunit ribosomal protein S6
MNSYETLFIIKPTLTEEEIKDQISKVAEIISQKGGKVRLIDEMGMRRLAYPINKQQRGYYAVVYHNSPANLIAELEYQLRYNENILRFMTVKYVTKKEISKFEEVVNKNSKPEETQEPKEESTASEATE